MDDDLGKFSRRFGLGSFFFRFPEAKHAAAFYSDLKPGDINRNREVSGGIYLEIVTLYIIQADKIKIDWNICQIDELIVFIRQVCSICIVTIRIGALVRHRRCGPHPASIRPWIRTGYIFTTIYM